MAEKIVKDSQSLAKDLVNDCISRQAAIDALGEKPLAWTKGEYEAGLQNQWESDVDALKELPPAQPEQSWIPFRSRPMTEEEKEMHPDIDSILDCKLPDDGQAILVTIEIDGRWWVNYDEYYEDGGSYLDSGYEICTEAKAWMPLPDPYKEDDHETD